MKNGQPSNSPPIALNDGYSTGEDTALTVAADLGLLANDCDAENDLLVAELVSGPAHGELQMLKDGSFRYTPSANFNGADSFTYKVSDGELESAVATVSLTVQAVNDTPAFSSTPTTTFTVDADAASFDGDGVFRVAGAPGESVTVQLDWIYREALYNNEVGIYRVSDTGRPRGRPAARAMPATRRRRSRRATHRWCSQAARPPARVCKLQLEGGAMYAFYVIQNGKTSTFLANNPEQRRRTGGLWRSSRSRRRTRMDSITSTPRSSLRPGR